MGAIRLSANWLAAAARNVRQTRRNPAHLKETKNHNINYLDDGWGASSHILTKVRFISSTYTNVGNGDTDKDTDAF